MPKHDQPGNEEPDGRGTVKNQGKQENQPTLYAKALAWFIWFVWFFKYIRI